MYCIRKFKIEDTTDKQIDSLMQLFRNKTHKSSWLIGTSPLALAACGGGGGGTPSNGDTSEDRSIISPSPEAKVDETAQSFRFSEQFTSKVGYTGTAYKVYTEGTTETAFESDDFSLPVIKVAADLNNDGYDDILVDFSDTMVEPDILINDGTGNFDQRLEISGDGNPRTIRNTSVEDLNGDGYLDIVAYTSPHPTHSDVLGPDWGMSEPDIIFYNNAGESFTAVALTPETYNHGGDHGDLNGDGVFEIFSLAEWPPAPIMEGNDYRGLLVQENGVFVRSEYTLPVQFDDLVTSDMRIADINGDGFDDLIIATSPRYKLDDALYSNANSTPDDAREVGSFKVGISDGTLEISNYSWSTYGSFPMSNEDWEAFKASNKAPEGTDMYEGSGSMAGVSNIELLDINGDGLLDVVVGYYVQYNTDWTTSDFDIFINEGGTFVNATETYFPDQSSNENVLEATKSNWNFYLNDIDGDGDKDFSIYSKTVDIDFMYEGEKSSTIFINDGGVFYPAERSDLITEAQVAISDLMPANLNGEGAIDFVQLSKNPNDTWDLISHVNTDIM